MPTMTVTDARKNLFGLIDDVADEHVVKVLRMWTHCE